MLIAQFSSVNYTIMMFFRHIVMQLTLHIYVYLFIFIYVDSKILPPESYPEAVICPESN